MARDTKKGNISSFLIILEILTLLSLLFYIGKIILQGSKNTPKYKNPTVSKTVEEGSIYDSNKKTISMHIPVYSLYLNKEKTDSNAKNLTEKTIGLIRKYTNLSQNDISLKLQNSTESKVLLTDNLNTEKILDFSDEIEGNNLKDILIIRKHYTREYPFNTYAIDTIKEAERILHNHIKPVPKLNTDVTYGSDVYLTIDIDMQYILETVLSKLLNNNTDYVCGCIIDTRNGAIKSASVLHNNNQNYNKSLNTEEKKHTAIPSSIVSKDTYLVEKIVQKNGSISDFSSYTTRDFGFKTDDNEILSIYENKETGLIASVPSSENPAYYVLLGIKQTESRKEDVSDSLYNAVAEIRSMLYSASKL